MRVASSASEMPLKNLMYMFVDKLNRYVTQRMYLSH